MVNHRAKSSDFYGMGVGLNQGHGPQEFRTSIDFKNDERNMYLFEMNTKTLIDGYI